MIYRRVILAVSLLRPRSSRPANREARFNYKTCTYHILISCKSKNAHILTIAKRNFRLMRRSDCSKSKSGGDEIKNTVQDRSFAVHAISRRGGGGGEFARVQRQTARHRQFAARRSLRWWLVKTRLLLLERTRSLPSSVFFNIFYPHLCSTNNSHFHLYFMNNSRKSWL